ncbi:MAG: alanine--tRNA ligase-related protein, partial [Ktedonobacterales bacterium]
HVESAFDTDLFAPALARLREISANGTAAALDPQRRQKAQRLIVDHARSTLFAGLVGVVPGRDGRESVPRSLIRRAARTGHSLGLTRPFLGELLEPLAEAHGNLLTSDERAATPTIARMLTDEERGFQRTLAAGLRELDRLRPDERAVIHGERLFTLHAERGFPSDLAGEILAERGLAVDWSGYERAMAAHRAVSREHKA